MEKEHEKSKHATDLRGLCLIHDNAGAYIQDFLETEPVVQLPNSPYSPDLSPYECFPVYFTRTQSPQTST